MAARLRLYDYRVSRGPQEVGLCQEDVAGCAQMVNGAQERLLFAREAGEEGWFGTWAEMAFRVSQLAPYLTLPRGVARLESINVCDRPKPIFNQFYEYLDFGNGRLPKIRPPCGPRLTAAYMRNMVPTFIDPPASPFIVSVFPTSPQDFISGVRVLVQGLDESGNIVYGTDQNGNQVLGEYVTIQSPFASTTNHFTRIDGLQKDVTVGAVQIAAVRVDNNEQTILLSMEPGEEISGYRRYYFDSLPRDCCFGQGSTAAVSVTAIAKLDLIPVKVDSDWLLIPNLEAIIAEAGSIRYSAMDSTAAKTMSAERHQAAVRLLNGQLAHYLGKENPAVDFKPFGSASFNQLTQGFM